MTLRPKSDWWQYRSKCQLCGWDGPDELIMAQKQMGFSKFFGICPSCGNWKYKRALLHTSKFGKPVYSHTSCLSGYAVHKGCGRWHKAGTTCPDKSD